MTASMRPDAVGEERLPEKGGVAGGTAEAGGTEPAAAASAAPVTAPAIRVENLRKTYGELRAVDGISFQVKRGDVFGLLGPNGAGKTTTLEILEGLLPPTSGSVEVAGLDVTRAPGELKERIGVQLQTTALFETLTVYETLHLYRGLFRGEGVPPEELIRLLHLGEKKDALVRTLSGGQKQRLSIALALVNDPEIVFLDEPTTGLDPAARRSLWDVNRDLKAAGRTVLLSTHYMEEAEALCDLLAILDHGRIIALGTPGDLLRENGQASLDDLFLTLTGRSLRE